MTQDGEPSLHQRRPKVAFVPFPHKSLGSGEDASCQWTTRPISPNSSQYDSIQRAAYTEGICVPTLVPTALYMEKLELEERSNKALLHVFSASEAIECLSPNAQGKLGLSVVMSGDSYTRQFFIGLADVLLGRPGSDEIRNQDTRLRLLESSNEELARRRHNDTSFPDVQYKCHNECYGNYNDAKAPFSVRCSECMNNHTRSSEHAVGVVGAGVHVLTYFHNRVVSDDRANSRTNNQKMPSGRDVAEGETLEAVNRTVSDIQQFLNLSRHTTYVSMPSYEIEKVPLAYRDAAHHTHAGRIHEGLLGSLAPHDERHPFIDVFQLTRACHMKNCSYDGGHRSRYVNRWKAQLLLNTLCEMT